MINNIELFKKYEKQALDINASCWISASAGGGKTTLIAKRILKILAFSSIKIFHVEHFKIFAITYTNEAANEIRKRIKNRLREWKESNEILNLDLNFFEIENHFNNFEKNKIKNYCKNLFDKKAFDIINISTFHSFCFDILNQFSSKINLKTNLITILDEDSINIFFSNAIKNSLLKKKLTQFSVDYILDIVLSLKKYQNEINCSTWNNLNSNLQKIIHENVPRGTFSLKKENDKILFYKKYLYTKFNLKAGFINMEEKENVPRGTFSYSINKKAKNETKCSTWNNFNINEIEKIDIKIATQLKKIHYDLINGKNIQSIFQNYLEIFLTKDMKPRINISKKEIFNIEQNNLMFHVEQFSTLENIENSKKIFNIMKDIFKNFAKYKKENYLLDFDDVINQTYLMLSSSKNKEYISYELSKKIQHLIIDESQDNSKKQWNVVKILTESMLYEKNKNFFIVGDFKQSIYGFQGAEPRYFHLMKEFLKNKSKELRKKIYFIDWDFSFRMSKSISNHVDTFFNSSNLSSHLSLEENFVLNHINFSHSNLEIVPRGTFSYPVNKKVKNETKCSTWNIFSKKNQHLMKNKLFHVEQFKKYIKKKLNLRKIHNKEKMFHVEHFLTKLVKNLKTKNNIPCGTSKKADIFYCEDSEATIYQKIINIIEQNPHHSIIILFRSRNQVFKNLIEELNKRKISTKYSFYENFSQNQTLKTIFLINEIITKCSTWNIFSKKNQYLMKNKLFHMEQFKKYIKKKSNLRKIHNKEKMFHVEHFLTKLTNKLKMKQNNIQRKINDEVCNSKQFKIYIQILSNLLNIKNTRNIIIFLSKLNKISKKYSYDLILEIIINYFGKFLDLEISEKILSIARKLKSQNLSSMQNFNYYMRANQIEILSKHESQSNVMISTIHGAKGLEADIVIIADEILNSKSQKKFYFNPNKKTFILLNNNNCFYVDFFKKQISEDEYSENVRLLYVAMTRAKKKLYILKNIDCSM